MSQADRFTLMRSGARRLLRTHRLTARLLLGAPPRVDDCELDVQTHILLAALERLPKRPYYEGTPAAARAQFDAIMKLADALDVPAPRVVDRSFAREGAQIPVRVVYPDLDAAPKPAVVYFHGGGFVLGSIETVDPTCHRMARATGAVVVNVGYRLAPESKMPGPAEDCLAAYAWVRENAASLGIDPSRVAVAGDSAGGALSAVVCQLARDARLPPPVLQVLIYPMTDTRPTRSRELFKEGFLLDVPTIDWFLEQYVQPGKEGDFRCSPLRRPDLSGLPPAHIVTAGFDPLRDEGEAYATRLRQAGNRVSYVCEKGLIHGFATMDLLDEARLAFGRICEVIRHELHA